MEKVLGWLAFKWNDKKQKWEMVRERPIFETKNEVREFYNKFEAPDTMDRLSCETLERKGWIKLMPVKVELPEGE